MVVGLPKTGAVSLSGYETRGMYAGELHSFGRVRDLVEKEEGRIFFGHDQDQFLTLRAAPEYGEWASTGSCREIRGG